MKCYKLSFLFLLIAGFVMASCAVRTEVQRVSIDDLRNNLKYENIIFNEFSVAKNVADYMNATDVCKNSAISHLNSKNLFKRVEDNSDSSYNEPTLVVDATILDYRVVSTAARMWGGILSGRSHMKVLVKLTDVATGELVAQKELFGAPNAYGSAYSFGASDRNIAANMGVLTGDFILANVSRRQ